MTKSKKPPKITPRHADAPGDFFYDELMTPQPDATQEFFRARLREIEEERIAHEAAEAGDDTLPNQRASDQAGSSD